MALSINWELIKLYVSSSINWVLIILGVLILAVVIRILIIWNKAVKTKLKKEEGKYTEFYNEIIRLKREKPSQKNLESLNKLARDFFYEKFKFGKTLSYVELSDKFKKENQINISNFCILMSNLIYSDKKDNSGEIKKAIDILSSIIESY